jgi:S1-C subfamily serine protease
MNEIPAARLRGFLGIAYDADAKITTVLGSSPAESAGLRVGDRLRDPAGLTRAVAGKGPGERVAVGVTRDGADMDIEVTLGGGF